MIFSIYLKKEESIELFGLPGCGKTTILKAIIKLFTDSSYLYMLSTTYTINDDISLSVPDVVSVYSKQITLGADGLWSLEGEWTKVVSGTDYFKFSIENEYCYS